MSARAALLTPFAYPSVRGNAVTVERIARAVAARGVALRVWDLAVLPPDRVACEVAVFRPDLVHAFHAWRTGPLALRLARQAGVPLVVTITGTDVNHDLLDPERRGAVREVLDGAAVVTAFHGSMVASAERAAPGLKSRAIVVPQSVAFETARCEPGPADPGPEGAGARLLFPAGIRPVKNPRFPLRPLDRVVTRRPDLRLIYVGPILDPEEGEALVRALAGRPWARHRGPVPHAQMPALLAGAAVVLNCSVSEGGMANAVLEALAAGRAVLASDIEGNRSLVEDGVTGFLFRSEEEFADKVERLLGDSALRRRLGTAGRARVEAEFPPTREVDGYLEAYRRARQGAGPR